MKLGEGYPLRTGTDLAILCAGTLLPDVLGAADHLAQSGVSAEVVDFHTVKPLDTALLTRVFAQYPLVATVEVQSCESRLAPSLKARR